MHGPWGSLDGEVGCGVVGCVRLQGGRGGACSGGVVGPHVLSSLVFSRPREEGGALGSGIRSVSYGYLVLPLVI